MELKKLTVHNYKSLVNFELKEPNAFTVFAGPNGAGKSNIFEALEFLIYQSKLNFYEAERVFYGREQILNYRTTIREYSIDLDLKHIYLYIRYSSDKERIFSDLDYERSIALNVFDLEANGNGTHESILKTKNAQKKYLVNFLRLFIKKPELNRIKYTSNERLLPDASNLESVLKRLLENEVLREELLEWLDLFIPGFKDIKIHTDNIGGTDTLLIFEKGTEKPFTKNLISDGTYNILALLTAVYQTNEPQFLCIEEPENGLNPYVVESLVDFFRRQCEEKGHVIWLNTHSQTLVKHLRPEELVLVDKVNGETKAKQFGKDHRLYGLEMDTAWLSNALGGGIPW